MRLILQLLVIFTLFMLLRFIFMRIKSLPSPLKSQLDGGHNTKQQDFNPFQNTGNQSTWTTYKAWLIKAFQIGKSIAISYVLIKISFQVVIYFEQNRNPDGTSVIILNLIDYYVSRIFFWPIDLIISISKKIVMTIAWVAFHMGPGRFVVIPLIVVFILWRILGTKKKNFIGKLPPPNESEPPPIKPE